MTPWLYIGAGLVALLILCKGWRGACLMDGFLIPGVNTARLFGWVGFGCIAVSFLPQLTGIRRCRWLKNEGTDDAPPPGAAVKELAKNTQGRRPKEKIEHQPG